MKSRNLVILAAGGLSVGALLTLAGPAASRGVRPGVVGVALACLETSQQEHIIREIDKGSAGATSLPASGVDRACIVSPERAATMAPCGVAGRAFVPGCVLTALKGRLFGSGTELLSIINPDSMHPEDLVGANPTPHP